jgi:mannosyltransferase
LKITSSIGLQALGAGAMAFGAGFIGAGNYSYWGDEGPTLSAIRRTWPQLFGMLRNIDGVHSFYYCLLKIWASAFGYSEQSTRCLSALGFALASAALYVFLASVATNYFAWTAAIAFIAIPRNLYNADYARSFSITTFLAICMTGAFVWAIKKEEVLAAKTFYRWCIYSLIAALAFSFFVYLTLLALAHFVTALLMKVDVRVRTRLLWAVVGAVAVSSPVILAALGQRAQIEANSKQALTLRQILVTQWFLNPLPGCLAWILILVAIARLVTDSALLRAGENHIAKRDEIGQRIWLAQLALPWIALPTILLLLGSILAPVYAMRYLSFATPGLAIFVAIGITTFRSRAWVILGLAILLTASAPRLALDRFSKIRPDSPDWRSVSRTIGEVAHTGDAVILSPKSSNLMSPRLATRVYPDGFSRVADPLLVESAPSRGWLYDKTRPISDSEGILLGYSRIWVVESSVQPRWAMPQLRHWGFHLVRSIKLNVGHIYCFEH